ncbi:hypothetical protein, partial [Streptomyces sp. XY431]|uniref:hypothetical protein n=1 Tax=Streptomyces sp. XY431 TaxID=1415562 RepID=UPI000A9EB251
MSAPRRRAGRRAPAPTPARKRGRRGVVRQGPLRAHWVLFCAFLLALAGALLLQGYTQHLFDTRPDAAAHPAGN